MPRQTDPARGLKAAVDRLERHVTTLRAVDAQEPIGIIELARHLGLHQHEVRYSLRILEQAGLIKPSAHGAVTTERAASYLSELKASIDEAVDRLQGVRSSLE